VYQQRWDELEINWKREKDQKPFTSTSTSTETTEENENDLRSHLLITGCDISSQVLLSAFFI